MVMGPIRFERTTSSLSGTRSNQLSYEPLRQVVVLPWGGVGRPVGKRKIGVPWRESIGVAWEGG